MGNSPCLGGFLSSVSRMASPSPMRSIVIVICDGPPYRLAISSNSALVMITWPPARAAASWEVARREGLTASRDTAFDRAVSIFETGSTAESRQFWGRHQQLTPRELEILTLVGEGRSDGEIAERLFISPKTASVHVANVKAKIGAGSRVQTAIRAREMGLVRTH